MTDIEDIEEISGPVKPVCKPDFRSMAVGTYDRLQNFDIGMTMREPLSDAMCHELCKIIRECSSATFSQDALQHLLLKATGMSDMTTFLLSTWNCYTHTTHPNTRENRTSKRSGQQKRTVKRRKNTHCTQYGYKSVQAGTDTIHIKLYTEARTWSEASKICHSEGSMLAVPNTTEKLVAMIEQYQIQPGRGDAAVWIQTKDGLCEDYSSPGGSFVMKTIPCENYKRSFFCQCL